MPELIFINVQDQPGLNKRQVKRHIASSIHRKKRMVAVSQYQRRRKPEREHIRDRGTPENEATILDPKSTDETDPAVIVNNEQSSPTPKVTNHGTQSQLKNMKRAMYRWRLGGPTAVSPPGDDLQVHNVLDQAFHWFLHQYNQDWSIQMRQNSMAHDLDTSIEIVREAFYVVSDLLAMDKVGPAFHILHHTLDSIPKLLRRPHPELLFTLVELASGINMPTAVALNLMVRAHVADLTRLILGVNHPSTVLLKAQFDPARRTHVTEMLIDCIVNAVSLTFGQNAYQTLVHQMGQSQFYLRAGRETDAQAIISHVFEQWQEQYGNESPLARLATLELSLMRLHTSRNTSPVVGAEVNNAMLRIEAMTGICGAQPTNVLFPQDSRSNRPQKSLALAQWFLLKKHYTLALHVYNLPKADPWLEIPAFSPTKSRTLNDIIVNAVYDALGGTQAIHENVVALAASNSYKPDFLPPG